jgi:hypothetical protein
VVLGPALLVWLKQLLRCGAVEVVVLEAQQIRQQEEEEVGAAELMPGFR